MRATFVSTMEKAATGALSKAVSDECVTTRREWRRTIEMTQTLDVLLKLCVCGMVLGDGSEDQRMN
jgi:hypothetical protein